MIEEVGEVFEGLFEYFHARQVHDAEVIGLGPVKAAAARGVLHLPQDGC